MFELQLQFYLILFVFIFHIIRLVGIYIYMLFPLRILFVTLRQGQCQEHCVIVFTYFIFLDMRIYVKSLFIPFPSFIIMLLWLLCYCE
jgi:hypothetical protein